MNPDPAVLAWLEDPDRLADQRANEPDDLGLGHLCDDLCRPATVASEEGT